MNVFSSSMWNSDSLHFWLRVRSLVVVSWCVICTHTCEIMQNGAMLKYVHLMWRQQLKFH